MRTSDIFPPRDAPAWAVDILYERPGPDMPVVDDNGDLDDY